MDSDDMRKGFADRWNADDTIVDGDSSSNAVSGVIDSENTIEDDASPRNGRHFKPGDVILGQYQVLSELGQGGMGVVYRCMDLSGRIEVALKALPPELVHDRDEMEDIRDNFSLVANLVHQNIAACRTLAEDRRTGECYLVMECVEGESLRQWMRRRRREGALMLAEALPVLRQVADALDYAHGERVMHRDIKPGNIMVCKDGKVKVLDFGLAAQIRSSMSHVSMAYSGNSGTRPYMAPEQWEALPQDGAVDQYALAVVAYEMLSGQVPFASDDAEIMRIAVLQRRPAPIKGIPEYANRALDIALAKNPDERYSSCADFVRALGGERVRSGGAGAADKSRGLYVALGVAVIAALVLVCGVVVPNIRHRQTQKTEEVRQQEPRKAEEARKSEEEEAKKREEARTQLLNDLLEVKGKLESFKTEIDGMSLDRGKAFDGKLKAFRENLIAADTAFEHQLYDNAKAFYAKAAEVQHWIDVNIKPSENACKAKAASEESKKKALADANAARTMASDLYGQAERKYRDACGSYDGGHFAEAERLFNEASDYFMQAIELAKETHRETKDIADSVKRWRKAADQGNALAQYNLGWYYENGIGVQKDEFEAVLWYRMAADRGNAAAQNNLGFCYQYGRGVQKNASEAVRWYRKAAEQGYALAQNNLGWCYLNGAGVQKNASEAVRWYRKAAEQGDSNALYNLGLCYENGFGLERNVSEAVRWYRKAAEQGYADAKKALKRLGY